MHKAALYIGIILVALILVAVIRLGLVIATMLAGIGI